MIMVVNYGIFFFFFCLGYFGVIPGVKTFFFFFHFSFFIFALIPKILTPFFSFFFLIQAGRHKEKKKKKKRSGCIQSEIRTSVLGMS